MSWDFCWSDVGNNSEDDDPDHGANRSGSGIREEEERDEDKGKANDGNRYKDVCQWS